jgi:hypothetical protein
MGGNDTLTDLAAGQNTVYCVCQDIHRSNTDGSFPSNDISDNKKDSYKLARTRHGR